MNLKGKKILITGGFGFIGSHLSKELKKLDANVEIFDLSQGDDITDESKLKEEISKKYDAIFHLAGYSGSSESNENIEKSFRVNTIATINILNLVTKYSPAAKIVLSSSRLEYGTPEYLPVDENHLTNPISAYGLSKLAATQISLVYHKKYNTDVTIFRTSNVYGKHKLLHFSGYNLINSFIDLALHDKKLTIFGTGNQLRDYIYIDDLVQAFILSLSQNTSGEIYNLGFGKGIKLKEMAKLIMVRAGKGTIKFKKWPPKYSLVETGSYISDISKIKKDLGFKPKIGFEEGINKVIND